MLTRTHDPYSDTSPSSPGSHVAATCACVHATAGTRPDACAASPGAEYVRAGDVLFELTL
jgi:hypothetical protein